ncbi:MAG TPA: polyprenyl synthetase family protein [Streptosporangiaceae bacterium]
MTEVERLLAQAAHSEHPLIGQAVGHLVAAGGKRFRPLLTLIAAEFGPVGAGPEVLSAACVIELTHMATLYHDDVMDEAAIRRGRKSANSRWDNTVAILTGDYLFARASQILADLGPEAVRIQAETFVQLVTGQVAETVGPGPGQDPLDHYMSVVKNKTASLIATSGRFGGLLSGAPPEVTARITPACEALGVAFQLSDDIIDVASDSDQLGKASGTDLREGVQTLPMLHALRSPGPDGSRLTELLEAGELTDPRLHAEALALLRAHPAMDAARADMRGWASRARREIMALPDVSARTAFEHLCDFVVERSG